MITVVGSVEIASIFQVFWRRSSAMV